MFLTDKFYYISISRVATRSILRTLENLEMNFPEDIKSYNVTTFHLINEVFKDNKLPYTFSFVRNPIDRCLSLYRHAKREKWFTGNFKEYVELLDCYLTNFFSKTHFDKVGPDGYVNIIQESIPQHYYLFKDDGSTHVDFIGKYETLDEDWFTLSKRIYDKTSFSIGDSLPLLNERSNSMGVDFENELFIHRYIPPKEIIDDETFNLIYKIYKKDFKLLDYPKEIPVNKTITFKLDDTLNNLIFSTRRLGFLNGVESKEFLESWDVLSNTFLHQLNSFSKKGYIIKKSLDDMLQPLPHEGMKKFHYFLYYIVLANSHFLPNKKVIKDAIIGEVKGYITFTDDDENYLKNKLKKINNGL